MTKSSQELPLAAWILLLSQRQNFLNSHLASVPITRNPEGTMEMRVEVLSSVGVQDMGTGGYQVCDLVEVELHRKIFQLDVDVVLRPGIAKPFSPSTFDDFEMGSMAENPILIDKEQDKEDSPPPTSSASETPTHSRVLRRSGPFGTRIENFPDYVHGILFEYFRKMLLCTYFNENS